jgi:hypothetical protein
MCDNAALYYSIKLILILKEEPAADGLASSKNRACRFHRSHSTVRRVCSRWSTICYKLCVKDLNSARLYKTLNVSVNFSGFGDAEVPPFGERRDTIRATWQTQKMIILQIICIKQRRIEINRVLPYSSLSISFMYSWIMQPSLVLLCIYNAFAVLSPCVCVAIGGKSRARKSPLVILMGRI